MIRRFLHLSIETAGDVAIAVVLLGFLAGLVYWDLGQADAVPAGLHMVGYSVGRE